MVISSQSDPSSLAFYLWRSCGPYWYHIFMINLRETLTDAHTILEKEGILHALIGGFALAAYGIHRATIDIDLLADGGKKELIKTSFLNNGYQVKFESPEVLQFIGPGFIDILLANRPLSQEMIRQARANPHLGVHILRPEDIIGLKIQAYKNDFAREHQDKADIQALLQLKSLDMNLIRKYADLFGEWVEIERLRARI